MEVTDPDTYFRQIANELRTSYELTRNAWILAPCNSTSLVLHFDRLRRGDSNDSANDQVDVKKWRKCCVSVPADLF